VILRSLIGFLLIAEGLWSGVSTVQRLPLPIAAGDVVTTIVVAARGLISLILFASGWMLRRNPQLAWRLGIAALTSSALLRTMELGAGLSPGNVFIAWRWPIVIAYWGYAMVLAVALARWSRRAHTT
jgi:hypothetical protein